MIKMVGLIFCHKSKMKFTGFNKFRKKWREKGTGRRRGGRGEVEGKRRRGGVEAEGDGGRVRVFFYSMHNTSH